MSAASSRHAVVQGSQQPIGDGFLKIDRCREILDPFQARWRDLAAEAEQLGAGWIEHPDSYYAPSGWHLSIVRYFGIDNPEGIAAAPLLGELVARDNRVMTAQYFRLGPGATVAPHQGRAMGVGRFHLGLSVPDDCALQIGRVSRAWVEGEWLAFDDSRVHTVWNRSDSARVIMSLDFEHPDIPMPRWAYAHRSLLGTYYDFVRRSRRTRRAMLWYNREIRSRLWPLDASPEPPEQ